MKLPLLLCQCCIALTMMLNSSFSTAQSSLDVYRSNQKTGSVHLEVSSSISDEKVDQIFNSLSNTLYIGKVARTGRNIEFVFRQSEFSSLDIVDLVARYGAPVENNYRVHEGEQKAEQR